MTEQQREAGRQELFSLMRQEHGVTCMESELTDIEQCVLSYALSHAEGEVVDKEDLADALYLAGYSAARKERDYDPRGCDQWQAVVDAIYTHPAPQVAVPEGWLIRRVDDRITVQHPDIGGYCASMDEDDRSSIAPVILYHLADAMLAAAPTAPAGESDDSDMPLELVELPHVLAWADGIRGDMWTEYADRITDEEARVAQAVWAAHTGEQPASDPGRSNKQVGCEREDGTLNIHDESKTCAVCAPDEREIAALREALEKIAPYPKSPEWELDYPTCRRIAREALEQGSRLRAGKEGEPS